MNGAVIFDLDGTLLNTLPDIYDNVNKALIKFGFPKRNQKEITSFIGNGAKNLIISSIGVKIEEEKLLEVLGYYNYIYTNCGSPLTYVYKGIDKTLKELKEKGYKLAILTNKPQMTTEKVYEKYLKDFSFDMVVGQSSKIKCKPDADGINYILSSLNVDKSRCFMVGDGETDVLTALNANVIPISVTYGYRSKEDLLKVGAKYFASTPKEIFSLIDKF